VAPARRLTHARILLKADQGEGGAAWATRPSPGRSRSTRPRWRGCASNSSPRAGGGARPRAPRREYPRKLDGEREARLVAVACSTPPTGYERWSLRLLADELVRLEVVEAVSHETVRQTLQQTI
jgi:hypothetical protein